MHYIKVGSRDYRRALFSMLLGSLVTFAIMNSIQTLISTFTEQFHISPSTSSLTMSLPTIMLAISMTIISVYSNAWGRKKIMGVSLLLTSLLNIAVAFSPNFHTLLFFRTLQGIAMGGFPAVAMTYLSEEIAPEDMGKVMGIYVGGSAVGGFAGRMIVSTLTDLFSWNLAILSLGLFSLLCSLLFLLYLPESRNFKKAAISLRNWAIGMASGLKNKKLFPLYCMGFLFLGVYVTFFNYLGFPLSQSPYYLSQTVIGFLFIFQLTGSWSSYLFGKLTARYSRTGLISWSVGMSLLGALMTLSDYLPFFIIGIILFASGFFAGHTVASSWVGVIAPPQIKAYASSLYLLLYYTGSSFIGWTGGIFLKQFGWNGVIFLICGLLMFTRFPLLQINESNSNQKVFKTT